MNTKYVEIPVTPEIEWWLSQDVIDGGDVATVKRIRSGFDGLPFWLVDVVLVDGREKLYKLSLGREELSDLTKFMAEYED